MNITSMVISVILIGAIAFVAKYEPTPMSEAAKEKQKFEYAAVECWKSYEKKSNTPSEKIGIAKFCEGLEDRAKAAK